MLGDLRMFLGNWHTFSFTWSGSVLQYLQLGVLILVCTFCCTVVDPASFCWLLFLCVGYRSRASSSSPGRRPYEEHRHGSDLNHSGAPPRGREVSSRREASGRYRDYSPPHARGGGPGARPHGRGFDAPEPTHGLSRNNHSKVQPRDGDWYCLDPL